ncbi:MAG: hypothetical protein EB084_03515 [Proteobacteria bacterium]|nr:hypothetical protein [Pseudomonadota bacterium]
MRKTALTLASLILALAVAQALTIAPATAPPRESAAAATRGFPMPSPEPLPLSDPTLLLETRFFEMVKPSARESQWRSIPWMTRLWKARLRAAEEGKPLLLWCMDGNPLGST